MAREAVIEMNCVRYSEKIIDIVRLFNESGWQVYDDEKKIEYLPLGDNGEFNWQKKYLSLIELRRLINEKQNRYEMVGLILHFDESEQGITILTKSTETIIIGLDINRKTMENTRDSITDVGWYFTNIIQRIKKGGAIIDYIKFEDFVD